ncbi:MAG: TerB family tellurite resistance protein [Minwuia sp.]|uniref:TerB family tellurite resistance protein n=1 Tax=Minwuia sp. TaxID=2493630 RepID=UPI003A843B20
MSIWGKLIGGGIGFAFGGPIGALIGGIAGHAVDRVRESDEEHASRVEDGRPAGTKQIAFTIGVIVLGAKMAKADGVVTSDEIEAFREVFQVPEDELKNVARVFNQAKQDATGFEPYARQIADMFRQDPEVLEDLMAGLMHIARADNVIHPDEVAFLKSVAGIFGLSDADYRRLHATYLGPDEEDPYTVLGIDSSATDAQVKSAYRELIKKNHPDRAMAQGMPEEFIAVANEKLAKINAAYDQISRIRGLG